VDFFRIRFICFILFLGFNSLYVICPAEKDYSPYDLRAERLRDAIGGRIRKVNIESILTRIDDFVGGLSTVVSEHETVLLEGLTRILKEFWPLDEFVPAEKLVRRFLFYKFESLFYDWDGVKSIVDDFLLDTLVFAYKGRYGSFEKKKKCKGWKRKGCNSSGWAIKDWARQDWESFLEMEARGRVSNDLAVEDVMVEDLCGDQVECDSEVLVDFEDALFCDLSFDRWIEDVRKIKQDLENVAAGDSYPIVEIIWRLEGVSCRLRIVDCDNDGLCDWKSEFYQLVKGFSPERVMQDPAAYASRLSGLIDLLP
jgi:hypothetical protein